MRHVSLLAICLLCTLIGFLSAAESPTHVVLIFTDDQGYGDAACYGHPSLNTPVLDRLAAEGVRCTDFLTASSVCTPSRAALLTGRYAVRSGMTGVLAPNSLGGLPDSETTIAEHLQAHGYATHMIGKWHLGHLRQFLPDRHGFDTWFGTPYSNDMLWGKRGDPEFPLMTAKNDTARIIAEDHGRRLQPTLTERYTTAAEAIIAEHNPNQGMFLYIAHTFPHVPLYPNSEFLNTSRTGVYGDIIEELDASTGRVLAALEAKGMADNTLFIYTSDNGPWLKKGVKAGSSGPLRGGKMTTFEGGHRVPAFFRYPNEIPAGTVSRDMTSTLDLFATICDFAGIPDHPAAVDSNSLKEHLTTGASSPRQSFAYFWKEEIVAWRSGEWKLHRKERSGADHKPGPWPETMTPTLYNVAWDPAEVSNLRKRQPQKTDELLASLEAFEEKLVIAPDQCAATMPPDATKKSLDYARVDQAASKGETNK